MRGLGPVSGAAETLTLSDCISAADFALSEDNNAVRAAVAKAAEGIPATALATSDAEWRKAFETILGIQVGRMFKAACLKFSVDAPTVEADADGAASVTLLPFVLESSHHPTIVATFGAVVVPFRFDVELSLEVEGARLHVKDGRFVGASTGTARGVARISLLNAKPPIELGSPAFHLPGELEFSAPVIAKESSA